MARGAQDAECNIFLTRLPGTNTAQLNEASVSVDLSQLFKLSINIFSLFITPSQVAKDSLNWFFNERNRLDGAIISQEFFLLDVHLLSCDRLPR